MVLPKKLKMKIFILFACSTVFSVEIDEIARFKLNLWHDFGLFQEYTWITHDILPRMKFFTFLKKKNNIVKFWAEPEWRTDPAVRKLINGAKPLEDILDAATGTQLNCRMNKKKHLVAEGPKKTSKQWRCGVEKRLTIIFTRSIKAWLPKLYR